MAGSNTMEVFMVIALIFWYYRHAFKRVPRGTVALPGPNGLPFIGNILDIPSSLSWETYVAMGRTFASDIIGLQVLGTNIVIVNSEQIANDLLEKRSSIYSDRSDMTMLCELVGFQWALAFMHYGKIWRESRRALHHEFHPAAVERFRLVEEQATHAFLHQLLHRPEDFLAHIRHMAGKIIMKLTYGIDIQVEDDPYIAIAEAATTSISETTNAGSYLVDIIPMLKYIPEWFPGATFKRKARVWRESADMMRDRPFYAVKQSLSEGVNPECIATSLLDRIGENEKDPQYMDGIIRGALGSIYGGGADTTVSSLESFFLAMVLNPDVQLKAQQELDRVVGPHRLPQFSDRAALPYIAAIVKEVLRWAPVIPLAVPHRSTMDDIYNGYHIPKGSLIVGNIWAMLYNEKIYQDPKRFNPDRFLKAGVINTEVRDPTKIVFGFGRRICIGRFMALDSIWITIASILSVFNITKSVDADGTFITPDAECIPGFLCHPRPFPCTIRVRSEASRALICM